ncbi:UNVERIFIED_CONTAM: hypothetical protein HDU68_006911, partial [Siphonaria sp. JEL0065]
THLVAGAVLAALGFAFVQRERERERKSDNNNNDFLHADNPAASLSAQLNETRRQLRQANAKITELKGKDNASPATSASSDLGETRRRLQQANEKIAELSNAASLASGGRVGASIDASHVTKSFDEMQSMVGSLMEESKYSPPSIVRRLEKVRQYAGTTDNQVATTLDTFTIGMMHVDFGFLVQTMRLQVSQLLLDNNVGPTKELQRTIERKVTGTITKNAPKQPQLFELVSKGEWLGFVGDLKLVSAAAPNHYLYFTLKCIEIGMQLAVVRPQLQTFDAVTAAEKQAWTDLYSYEDILSIVPSIKGTSESLVLFPGLLSLENGLSGGTKKRILQKALVVSA